MAAHFISPFDLVSPLKKGGSMINKQSFSLNRRIGFSLLSIAAAFAVMGGAAYAAFSSVASNNGNTFGAGDLVLKINGVGGSASTPVFGIAGAVPGSVNSTKITLTNTGSVDAPVVSLAGIDISGATPTLAGQLNLKIFIDTNDNGALDGGETVVGDGNLNDPAWTNHVLSGVSLPHGGTAKLGGQITFSSDAGNEFQGANVAFNLNFKASQ